MSAAFSAAHFTEQNKGSAICDGPSALSVSAGLQLIQNFFVFWEAKCFVFAVNDFSVDFDVKDSAFARDQFRIDTLG